MAEHAGLRTSVLSYILVPQWRPLTGAILLLIAGATWLCESVTILPLEDYPNHLARLFIQAHIGSDVFLSRYYQAYWHFQPNLALDAAAAMVTPTIGVLAAGNLLGAVTFASLAFGSVMLHRTLHGQCSPVALAPLLLVFNRFYAAGFIGYLLTLGISFIGTAVWIALEKQWLSRLVAGIFFATIIYLGHLYAFGIYAICTTGYEAFLLIRKGARDRVLRITIVIGQLIPAVFLFFFASPGGEVARSPGWRPFIDKLAGLVVLIPGYDLALESVILGSWIICIAGACAFRNGSFRYTLLPALIALALLYGAMPDQLMNSYGADRRLLVPLAFLIFLSFHWPAATLRELGVQWALLGILLLGEMCHIGVAWHGANPKYDDLLQLTEKVQRGSHVAGITINRSREYMPFPPLHEAVALFVIERSAFVPSLFAYPAEPANALRYVPPYASLAIRSNIIHGFDPVVVQQAFARQRLLAERNDLDYFLLIDERDEKLDLPSYYQLVAATADGRARLYHLSK